MYSIGLSYKCKKLSRYCQGHFFDKVADEIFVINVGGYIGESTRSVFGVFATVVSSWCYPKRKFHTFAADHGETNVLKRESGERPELCPQRYVL